MDNSCDAAREKDAIDNAEHRETARDIARECIVLLKNTASLLPLECGREKIAAIGPLVRAESEMVGPWRVVWRDPPPPPSVTLWEALSQHVPAEKLSFSEGCSIDGKQDAKTQSTSDDDMIFEAVRVASEADVVILAVGESSAMSGESCCRDNLRLPGAQEKLVQAVAATGKRVIAIVFAGRPLVLPSLVKHSHAVLYAWWLGTEAGNALVDVLFGGHNPSGRLPVSFPPSEGQIPTYYSYKNTGVPYRTFAYLDVPAEPAFAFGFGLSYTTFEYSDLSLDRAVLQLGSDGECVKLSFTLRNTGSRPGVEVAQLYMRDVVSSLTRPLMELKGFERVELQPGESRGISFCVGQQALAFYVGDGPDVDSGKNSRLEKVSL